MTYKTYKQIILKTLEEYDGWIPSWQLEKAKTKWGWIGSSGGRRCRELAQAGLIDRRISGRYVEYRAIQKQKRVYIPINNNTVQEVLI